MVVEADAFGAVDRVRVFDVVASEVFVVGVAGVDGWLVAFAVGSVASEG